MKWKAGLVFCFLHRAWKICSSANLFSVEVNLLRDIFRKNGYPIKLFEKILEKFHHHITSSGASVMQDDSSDDCDEDTRRYVLRLPFVQNISLAIAKKLQDILLRKLDVKIDVVYKSCRSTFSLVRVMRIPPT